MGVGGLLWNPKVPTVTNDTLTLPTLSSNSSTWLEACQTLDIELGVVFSSAISGSPNIPPYTGGG